MPSRADVLAAVVVAVIVVLGLLILGIKVAIILEEEKRDEDTKFYYEERGAFPTEAQLKKFIEEKVKNGEY
jgi:NADH:ubiquinone oxidoreductase subunit 3 (subunit A)